MPRPARRVAPQDLGVNPNVISWNRVVLLHGPPGTGKTTLSKALAQKVAIRLSHVYQQGHLIEVNAHSLFSKWFSESGKMVLGMFTKIREILEARASRTPRTRGLRRATCPSTSPCVSRCDRTTTRSCVC